VKTTSGVMELERPRIRGAAELGFESQVLGKGVARPQALEALIILGFLRRNITSKLTERHHREVKARYWAVLDEATCERDAKARLLALAVDYRAAYPSAMRIIDDHVDQLVAHLRFSLEHRKRTRSTNLLERTFVEVRRRTKIIGRFPGETSALSRIWAATAVPPGARAQVDDVIGNRDRVASCSTTSTVLPCRGSARAAR
jgi:hypothetical protein